MIAEHDKLVNEFKAILDKVRRDLSILIGLEKDTKVTRITLGTYASAVEISVVDKKDEPLFGHTLSLHYDREYGMSMNYGSLGSFSPKDSTRIRHCQNLALVSTRLEDIENYFKNNIDTIKQSILLQEKIAKTLVII